MKNFKEYLKEYTGVGNVVSTDYKSALKQMVVKPGSKEWQALLFMLDGDEHLAEEVLDRAAEEATMNFLKMLGVGYSPNCTKVPAPEKSEAAWVGDKGETVGIINNG